MSRSKKDLSRDDKVTFFASLNSSNLDVRSDGGLGGLIGGAAAVASLVYKVGGDHVPKLISGKPILVRITNSTSNNEGHTVDFSIENISENAVYIEEIIFGRPPVGLAKLTAGPHHGTSPPWHLESKSILKFAVALKKSDMPASIAKKPYGYLSVKYSPLDEKDSRIAGPLNFRVR